MSKKKLSWSYVCLLISTLAIYTLLVGGVILTSWADRSHKIDPATVVELEPEMSLNDFSQVLYKNKIISHRFFFVLWVKLHRPLYEKFQAGIYRFEGDLSPRELIRTIRKGEVYNPIVFEYTIPEGVNLAYVREFLLSQALLTQDGAQDLQQDLQDGASSVQYGVSSPQDGATPQDGARASEYSLESSQWLDSLGIKGLEGFLFPARYRFFRKMPTLEQALKAPVEEFFRRIPQNYRERLQAVGLSLEEWVTFASLIEKETSLDEERPLIAEVIWKRLRMGIPLGIDAALIYGIPNYDGQIRTVHLRDKNNPYNTRIHRGLPPTPIGSPSLASLEAVFNPSSEGYLYFVLLPGDTKRHRFSRTFREHQNFVRELVRYQKQRRN